MRKKKDLDINRETIGKIFRDILAGIFIAFDLGITSRITFPMVTVTIQSNDISLSISFVYSEKCKSQSYITCRYQIKR